MCYLFRHELCQLSSIEHEYKLNVKGKYCAFSEGVLFIHEFKKMAIIVRKMKHYLHICLFFLIALQTQAQEKKVVVFEIKEEIAPSATRITQKALAEARKLKADLLIVHMNTFGGLLTDADSIRTALLNAPMPVIAYIDNNAASAGALISIACDKIYMRRGANIGAATVVDQSGAVLPDKYQSYMRAIMRSTAESQGYDTLISGSDTILKYKRDPLIAEAMVDPRTVVPGISDSGEVLTLTTEEAISAGYCEGTAETIDEILKKEGLSSARVIRVEKSGLDKFLGFITHPGFSSVLILIIIAGIYFELQSPGIGFPLLAAIVAALLYFAPLYLEGLAANWEILLFIIGIGLVVLELFAFPGFGVAGISGIVLVISALVLSLVRNVEFDFSLTSPGDISGALLTVLISLLGAIVVIFLLGGSLLKSTLFKRIVLESTLEDARTHMGNEQMPAEVDTRDAMTHTDLRPIGKIKLGDEIVQAKTMGSFIEQGKKVKILGKEFDYYLVQEIEST